jgi:hypothetical protein
MTMDEKVAQLLGSHLRDETRAVLSALTRKREAVNAKTVAPSAIAAVLSSFASGDELGPAAANTGVLSSTTLAKAVDGSFGLQLKQGNGYVVVDQCVTGRLPYRSLDLRRPSRCVEPSGAAVLLH